jgi:hypothetical protein
LGSRLILRDQNISNPKIYYLLFLYERYTSHQKLIYLIYNIYKISCFLDTYVFYILLRELKEKNKTKKKNYSRRKKVHIASFLRRSRMPSGGEA